MGVILPPERPAVWVAVWTAHCSHSSLSSPLSPPFPSRHPDAVEVLRALALSRGWVVGSGLPDEVRAGRRILKDYIDGKLMFCKAPPGSARAVRAVAAALAHGGMPEALACSSGAPALEAPSGGGQEEASTSGEEDSEEEEGPGVSAGAGAELDLADLELLEELKLQGMRI